MFGLFKKDPLKKLNTEYLKKLKDGMEAQRSGDIFKYSELSKEADQILKKIKSIEASIKNNS
jgi:hypothetical protein|tara:strand:+ start:99 stop:284 length:186 start_codon:yes stop_codon:yes gene_type:complete